MQIRQRNLKHRKRPIAVRVSPNEDVVRRIGNYRRNPSRPQRTVCAARVIRGQKEVFSFKALLRATQVPADLNADQSCEQEPASDAELNKCGLHIAEV
jgi:hypothetical protein